MPRRHKKMPRGDWGLLSQQHNTSKPTFSTGVWPQPPQNTTQSAPSKHSSPPGTSIAQLCALTFLFISSSSSILAPPASLRTGLSRGDEPWGTAFKFTGKAGVKPRGLFSTMEESWAWSTGRPGWEDNKKMEWKKIKNYFKGSANKEMIHCYSKPELQSHRIFKKVKEKEQKGMQIQRLQCVSQSKGSVPCIPEVIGQCSKDRHSNNHS